MYHTQSPVTIATGIKAEQLTEGDVVIHCNSRVLVITEPEYTNAGIVFEALWLDVNTSANTQQLCFQPEEVLLLVSHTPLYNTRLIA